MYVFFHKAPKPLFVSGENNNKGMAEIKFLVEGVVCTGCAMDMENVLLDMEGVEDASVDFKNGIFSIVYDPAEIEFKTIVKKVKNLGFKTKILTNHV